MNSTCSTFPWIAEDIGTVQIPRFIERHWLGVIIEHNFGREFLDNVRWAAIAVPAGPGRNGGHSPPCKLVVHCGGCTISAQKLLARIRDLDSIGVSYTNYGIFLVCMQGPAALRRVLQPWGLQAEH